MKNLLITIVIFLLIFSLACDQEERVFNDDFIIEFGSVCGWCAGEELIKVSQSGIIYIRTIPCGDDKGTTQKERTISVNEWDQINASFDYAFFKTLEYNECNVCADGCDEFIKITESGNTDKISYSPEKQIEGLEDLKSLLNDLLEEMRKAD